MSKIGTFIRKTSVNNSAQTVYVNHSHKGSDFVKSTGVKVEPAFFLAKSGKVSSKRPDAPELNATISGVVADVERAARNIIGWGGVPDRSAMAKEYDAILATRKAATAALPRFTAKAGRVLDSLLAELATAEAEVTRLKREIMEHELSMGTYTGKLFVRFLLDYAADVLMSTSTAASYKSVAADFRLFAPNLKFEEMTPGVLDSYEKYLIGRAMNNVTIKTYVSKVKTVYRYYSEAQHVNPTALDRHKMQTKRLKETSIMFLTNRELQEISALTFESKSVESVRDLLLFMCATGLRYSDAFVSKDSIIGNYVTLTTKKTNTYVEIPLSKSARALLVKYKYAMPKYKLNYFNRIIKRVVAQVPSMTEEITQVRSKCGTTTTTTAVRRCDAVTAHVGRKTFATHALASGVNPAVLKGWLGHSKMEMMLNHYASGQHNTVAEMDKVSAAME